MTLSTPNFTKNWKKNVPLLVKMAGHTSPILFMQMSSWMPNPKIRQFFQFAWLWLYIWVVSPPRKGYKNVCGKYGPFCSINPKRFDKFEDRHPEDVDYEHHFSFLFAVFLVWIWREHGVYSSKGQIKRLIVCTGVYSRSTGELIVAGSEVIVSRNSWT